MAPPAPATDGTDHGHPGTPVGSRGRGRTIATIVVVVLVVVAGLGWAVQRADDAADPVVGSGAPDLPDAVPDEPGAVPGPGGGLGGGQGNDPLAVDPALPNPLPSPRPEEVVALQDVFALIDDAELVMLDFIFTSPTSDDGSFTESELALATEVATEAAAALRALQAELVAAGTDDGAAAQIREAYLTHLQDWIDWTSAVADDPRLLLAGGGTYNAAISTSADGFTASIRDSLGDLSSLPDDLAALVTEIVVRGFTGGGGSDSQADI